MWAASSHELVMKNMRTVSHHCKSCVFFCIRRYSKQGFQLEKDGFLRFMITVKAIMA